jgi:decaprenyl-phosphate phosphoribosyltransferase
MRLMREAAALRVAIRPETVPASAYARADGSGGNAAPPSPYVPPAVPRRPLPWAIVSLLRPRQWIKNGLVIAAAGAAGALGHDDVPVRVGLACVAFCMLASGLYAINDVRDAWEDRLHPRKRYRPVAAGEIGAPFATALGVGLMLAGMVLCVLVRPLLGAVGGGYLLITLSYTLVWRYIPILDVLAIGGGFVLRAVAGGVAAPVALSRWFVLVVSAAAVFVAAAKRYSELRRTGGRLGAGRRVLETYPPSLLRLVIGGSVAVAIFAYSVWAFELPAAGGVPWRPLTILPFAFCLLRYLARVRVGAAEAPEELLLGDRLLGLAALVWLVLFALGGNAAG